MSVTDQTVVVEIEGIEYQLRRRLDWMQQQKIDTMGADFVITGRDMQLLQDDKIDIEDIEKVYLSADPVRQNRERLEARLVNKTRREIKDLPLGHVTVLVKRIKELENEEKEEIAALAEENPTESDSI